MIARSCFQWSLWKKLSTLHYGLEERQCERRYWCEFPCCFLLGIAVSNQSVKGTPVWIVIIGLIWPVTNIPVSFPSDVFTFDKQPDQMIIWWIDDVRMKFSPGNVPQTSIRCEVERVGSLEQTHVPNGGEINAPKESQKRLEYISDGIWRIIPEWWLIKLLSQHV